MKQSLSDPCVYYMKDVKEKLELIGSVTVDDCAITWTKDKADWFINQLNKIFSITRGREMKKAFRNKLWVGNIIKWESILQSNHGQEGLL